MKKNLIYKILFWLVLFISSYIVLGIELNLLPLIPSHFSGTIIEKINRALLSLAYSIIAAYIFYFVTVVVPLWIQISKSKKILSHEVYFFLEDLYVLINQILYIYKIDRNIDDLEEKDLLCINGKIQKRIEGGYDIHTYWKSIWNKRKKCTGFACMSFIYPDDILKKLSEIPRRIEKIRMANPNFFVDMEFAQLLSFIETNKLRYYYKPIEELKPNMPLPFLYANSAEELYELVIGYRLLYKKGYHKYFRNTYNIIELYTKEELDRRRNDSSKSWNEHIVPILEKEQSFNPLVIMNSNIRDSVIIANELKYQWLEYNKWNDIQDSNRCVIIITGGIPSKAVNQFCRTNSGKRIIILLNPSLFFSSSNKKYYEGMQTSYKTYSIYYRSSKKIGFMELNKKYPMRSTLQTIETMITNIIRGCNI